MSLSPLNEAAKKGDEEKLRALLKTVSANTRDEHGATALHFAAHYGQLGVARLLAVLEALAALLR